MAYHNGLVYAINQRKSQIDVFVIHNNSARKLKEITLASRLRRAYKKIHVTGEGNIIAYQFYGNKLYRFTQTGRLVSIRPKHGLILDMDSVGNYLFADKMTQKLMLSVLDQIKPVHGIAIARYDNIYAAQVDSKDMSIWITTINHLNKFEKI